MPTFNLFDLIKLIFLVPIIFVMSLTVVKSLSEPRMPCVIIIIMLFRLKT